MSEGKEQSERLSAYLDGELTSADTWDLEKVIQSDPALAAELEALRATREMLRKLPAERAPKDFSARVLERAERRSLVGQTPAAAALTGSRWITFAAAAVVLLAACFGAFIMVQTLSPESGQRLASGGPDGETVAITPPAGPAGAGDYAVRAKAVDAAGARPGGPSYEDRAPARLARKKGTTSDDAVRAKPGGAPPAPVVAGNEDPKIEEAIASKRAGVPAPGKPSAAPVVSKGKLGPDAGAGERLGLTEVEAAVENVVIATADLDLARRDVEAVLARNGLRPDVLVIANSMDKAAADAELGSGVFHQSGGRTAPLVSAKSRGAFYTRSQVSPTQVRFEVPIEPSQIAKVKNELAGLPGWNMLAGQAKADQAETSQVDFLAYDDARQRPDGYEGMANIDPAERAKLYARAVQRYEPVAKPVAKKEVGGKAGAAPAEPRREDVQTPPAKAPADRSARPGSAAGEANGRDVGAAPAEPPRTERPQAALPATRAATATDLDAPGRPEDKSRYGGAFGQAAGSVSLGAQTAPSTRLSVAAGKDRGWTETYARQAGTAVGHSQTFSLLGEQQQLRQVGAKLRRLVITLNLSDSAREALRVRAAESKPAARTNAPADKAKSE